MKHFTNKTRTISAFLAVIVLFSSCASTTLIESIPSGGNLYLDGEPVGVTPFSMTDAKILGSCTSVKIEKENYDNYYGSICRDEDVDPGAIIGGIFFFFPFLWTMKYKPAHFFKLEPKGNNTESLDQLWKKEEKVQSQGETNKPQSIEKNGVIKLDEGNRISPEEFEQQKVKPIEEQK